MITSRRLAGMVTVALMLGLSSAAFAADTEYVAYLDGTRHELRAVGRALWMSTDQEIHFSLGLENIAFNAVGVVVVDGEIVDRIDIVDGVGGIHLNINKQQSIGAAFPRVVPGTEVEVYSIDGNLLLTGVFRKAHR